jgi:RNA polymerase sigma-70 factor (ECF subfamily)
MTVARVLTLLPPESDSPPPPLPPIVDPAEARPLRAAAGTALAQPGSAAVVSIDEPLVVRARTGDGAAFRALFERHSPGVRRYLGDLLRDEAAADDATQETFVRAYDRLLSLRELGRVQTWLFGIARNVFLEQYRARKEERRALPEADGESEGNELADTAPTPDLILLGQEADRVLASALTYVGEPRKSALLLRLDHGLSYEDIAEVMGWSVAKVKNEIHRARLQLRLQLARYLGGSS